MFFQNLTEISPPMNLEPSHSTHKCKPTPQHSSKSFVSHYFTYLKTSDTFPTTPSILWAKYLHFLLFFFHLSSSKYLSYCYLADTGIGTKITFPFLP